MMADLRYRLRALLRGEAMDRELDEELRFHVERAAQKHVDAGVPAAEALRRARVEFGGEEQIREATRAVRGLGALDVIRQDVRYAWRALRARPGFGAAVVLTLGLGVAANAVMFDVVDRLLLRSPPMLESPERVHRVYLSYRWNNETITNRGTEYRRFRDMAEFTTSFDAAAVVAHRAMAVGAGDAARERQVAVASASYFDFFAARPVLGRFFSEEDEARPDAPVVVLGNGFWRSEFGGRSDVVGTSLEVGTLLATIIGVAPRGFVGISEGEAPALFLPASAHGNTMRADWAHTYEWSWLELLLRRRADVPLAAAAADADAAFARSWEAARAQDSFLAPVLDAQPRAQLAPVQLARGPMARPDARVAVWVLGVAVIVLLIACANVVNLLLARAVQRRREIALRLALGVSRRRLVQQLATETLVLALLGAATGLLMAHWGGAMVRGLFLPDTAAGSGIVDPRTLIVVGVLTMGIALMNGIAPALYALREDVADALRGGMRDGGGHGSRIRTGLLLAQAALCVVLLTGAGLFLRSLDNVRALHLGYDVAPLLHVQPNMRGVILEADARAALDRRLLEAATSHAAVEHATLALSVPFWSYQSRGMPRVPGRDSSELVGRYTQQVASLSYFDAVGTRILRGRAFSPDDVPGGRPVVVISRSMADAIWPHEDALGQQLRFGGADDDPLLTVVGVAEDIRARELTGEFEHWYYLPMEQYREYSPVRSASLFIRVRGDAAQHADALRRRLQAEMPGAAYVATTPFAEILEPQQRAWSFGATMFGVFAALALLLAALGLYSTCAYSVAQRTRELGVRMALGASVASVVSLVARQALVFAAAGIVVGVAVVLFAGRWLQPLLFDVSARDPVVYTGVAAIMLLVTTAAAARPALRAARLDPTVALRE